MSELEFPEPPRHSLLTILDVVCPMRPAATVTTNPSCGILILNHSHNFLGHSDVITERKNGIVCYSMVTVRKVTILLKCLVRASDNLTNNVNDALTGNAKVVSSQHAPIQHKQCDTLTHQ